MARTVSVDLSPFTRCKILHLDGLMLDGSLRNAITESALEIKKELDKKV